MISERMYNQAKELIKLYEAKVLKKRIIDSLPEIPEGFVLEYRDLMGNWYEYTVELQDNSSFHPIKTRIRKKEETE